MNQWLIIRTPGGVQCWDLGHPTDVERELLVNAARVAVDFPAHDEWAHDGSPWDVQVTFGQPHPSLLARATVGSVADLAAADPAAIATHQAQRVVAASQDRIGAARAVLAALDPAERAQVLAP